MSFVDDYFIRPIVENTGYNAVNTAAYGFVLIFAVWLVFHLLKKMRVKIDRTFALSLLPFIFFGSSMRVMQDAKIYSALWLVTPGIYLVTFAITLSALSASLLVQRKFGVKYHKTMLAAGVALSLPGVMLIPFKDFAAFALIGLITAVSSSAFWVARKVEPRIMTRANACIMSGHMLDASATFVTLTFYASYGYFEQHVVPNVFIPIFGPVSMFALKLFVVLPVLLVIDRYETDADMRNFLKIVVLVLGLAPGLRDSMRLIAHV